MKYIGEFISLNDKQYKVEIITNGISSAETKITLGTDPVIITTESDGLFSPIKSRSCTINIVSDDFYFDMYASAAKQNEVLIYQYKNDNLILRRNLHALKLCTSYQHPFYFVHNKYTIKNKKMYTYLKYFYVYILILLFNTELRSDISQCFFKTKTDTR